VTKRTWGLASVLVGLVLGIGSLTAPVVVTSTSANANTMWVAGFETGDMSHWDGLWNSGSGSAAVTTRHAHSGKYSAALTISTPGGARLAKDALNRNNDVLPNAYYSVWYYFPQRVNAPYWWNVFQWKRKWCRSGYCSSDPIYTVNIGNRSDGSMYYFLYNHVGSNGTYNTSGVGRKASAPINIPLNTWVHLECYYKWSTSNDGRVSCWQNGQPLWNVTGVRTEYNYGRVSNPRQWTVNNYSDNTSPTWQTIYVDDAAIRSFRINP
jgi:hypothetical protein